MHQRANYDKLLPGITSSMHCHRNNSMGWECIFLTFALSFFSATSDDRDMYIQGASMQAEMAKMLLLFFLPEKKEERNIMTMK